MNKPVNGFAIANIELRETMFDFVRAGISVIPLALGGSKAPAANLLLGPPGKSGTWKPYQYRLATAAEMWHWTQHPVGIGLVCGVVSGGVEVFDFDLNADESIAYWLDQIPPSVRGRLTVVATGGGGFHVPYRCEVIGHSQKIAKTADGSGTVVETKGEGGYVVAVGSPREVHSSGKPYVQVMGEPLPSLPRFTPDERRAMFAAARELDQRTRRDVIAQYARRCSPVIRSADVDASTPWGDFDIRGDWTAILEPHGWRTGDGASWTRAGKRFGTSAKVVVAGSGCEVLTVFSVSAGPLAPDVGGHRIWGKFAAYAALNHGGDRREAAKAVRAMGYGRTVA
ncbi:bifunctional DNA primase/polymerase [Stieleria sp. ICT_E10.1]|uniref:bifunctional DNA primase/polymerase n=1 Tax=Stieleria sedimenti TaxID=2976331 RepID=UPI00217F69C4|nr:bifunctional DNA primase/polymerase [Stieleria sedimenti]MCS7466409.1 bifunctional DNA primase/polymerase [Stieleria sedimenti]